MYARLKRNEFLRGILVMAGGTGLGRGVAVLAAPFIARLYAPSDFGILATFASAVSILAVVATLRYELAVPLPEDDGTAGDLLILSLGIAAAMCSIFTLLLWPFGIHFLRWTNAEELGSYLWLLPLSLFGAALYQSVNGWAVRKKCFNDIAQAQVGLGVSQVAVQVALGMLGAQPAGLVAGHMIGNLIGGGLLAFLLRGGWTACGRMGTRVASLRATAYRYRQFPLLATGSGLLNVVGLRLAPLLMAGYYGLEAAGSFALSQLVLGAPMLLVGNAVGQTYFGAAANIARDRPSELLGFFMQTIRQLFVVGVLIGGAVALCAPWGFQWIFGERWAVAGEYARIMAPIMFVELAVGPVSATVYILNRQDLQLKWDAVRVIIIITVFYVSNMLGMSAKFAVGGFACAMVILYVVLFVLYRNALTLFCQPDTK